ncbi:sigma-70 family RNA polymerase sigma factor [Jatrophihabitans telluris]|uniref:RNA polymerase sigma factor n=1 Tax=Jatrophihabitans telluris TaxID=2038343 RepID=A0ABY4QUG5_9ACTN|nr:sigma-70 family RNA polymerase sigma factor [Jatrophihabitans telluris]UQX86938.1 sigma-70 family RNA polymerase sigma factor [Jatrophihabitans telluris]
MQASQLRRPHGLAALGPLRPDPVDDDLIVLLAAVGDGLAFAELYARTSAMVYRTVLRVLRDHAQADEVTQEVFLQAWLRAASYRPDHASVTTWLLTIAHRRAVDRVRQSEALHKRDDQSVVEVGSPLQESRVEEDTHLDVLRVRAALRSLSDAQREAVILSYVGGYNHREIAGITGAPLGTVKSRIRQGLHRLRLELDRSGINRS